VLVGETRSKTKGRRGQAILGHKTRSVFDRYHIVSPGDLQEATRRLAAVRDGHVSGHVRGASLDARPVPAENP
jgi:hypothetical protein